MVYRLVEVSLRSFRLRFWSCRCYLRRRACVPLSSARPHTSLQRDPQASSPRGVQAAFVARVPRFFSARFPGCFCCKDSKFFSQTRCLSFLLEIFVLMSSTLISPYCFKTCSGTLTLLMPCSTRLPVERSHGHPPLACLWHAPPTAHQLHCLAIVLISP